MAQKLLLLIFVSSLCIYGCGKQERLAAIDPTILPELRGHIQANKTAYQIAEPIVVGYWITNSSEKWIEEEIVDGSKEPQVPFAGYHFNAVSPQQKEQCLVLKNPGTPLQGKLRLGPRERKLFVTNIFTAAEPGPYVLSIELRWRDKKKVAFKPVTIAVQAKKSAKPEMDPAVEKALLYLNSPEFQKRKEARETIQKLGSRAAPWLIELLGNENLQLRSEAMILLIALKQEALPVLLTSATHPNREVRMRVIYALGEIGEVKALPAISKALLKDEDKDIRLTALRAVTKNFIDRIVIPLMISTLSDTEKEVRAAALDVLKGRAPADLDCGFQPDAPVEEREKAVLRWKQWWQQAEVK